MNQPLPTTELPVLTTDSSSCCGGGSCSSTSGSAPDPTTTISPATATPAKEKQMSEQATQITTQTFSVTGMTCGHCASAVTEELKQLPGVTEVDVDLVAGSTSTVKVTGTEPLSDDLVATALEEAGDYQLA
jgi:copper chaperone